MGRSTTNHHNTPAASTRRRPSRSRAGGRAAEPRTAPPRASVPHASRHRHRAYSPERAARPSPRRDCGPRRRWRWPRPRLRVRGSASVLQSLWPRVVRARRRRARRARRPHTHQGWRPRAGWSKDSKMRPLEARRHDRARAGRPDCCRASHGPTPRRGRWVGHLIACPTEACRRVRGGGRGPVFERSTGLTVMASRV